jgi:hypothetical protein
VFAFGIVNNIGVIRTKGNEQNAFDSRIDGNSVSLMLTFSFDIHEAKIAVFINKLKGIHRQLFIFLFDINELSADKFYHNMTTT